MLFYGGTGLENILIDEVHLHRTYSQLSEAVMSDDIVKNLNDYLFCSRSRVGNI